MPCRKLKVIWEIGAKGEIGPQKILNGHEVQTITSYLFRTGGDATPQSLHGMNDLFSQGTNPRSPGFIFADCDEECTPLSRLKELELTNPEELLRVHPYIGGEEVNQQPSQEPSRFIIFLDDIEEEAGLAAFPALATIVREKVKPGRDVLSANPNNDKLRRRWWAYHASRAEFYSRLRTRPRVLVNTQVSNHVTFSFQPPNRIFSLTLNVYDLWTVATFAILQSRIHEVWARFLGSHMKDDLRYTPSPLTTCHRRLDLARTLAVAMCGLPAPLIFRG